MSIPPETADPVASARAMLKTSMIDLSHWNHAELDAVKRAGIQAVFLKATQGRSWIDPKFFDFVKAARDLDMLIGAYHFGTAVPIADQIAIFAQAVSKAGGKFALALDFEKNEPDPENTMALSQAVEFLETLDKTGARPFLYGGGYLRGLFEMMHGHDPHGFTARLSRYRLWFNDMGYVKEPRLPLPWLRCTFWQYSTRIPVPGVSGACDSNHYFGNDLAGEFS